MMLILQHLSYFHSGRELLFEDISLTINRKQKIALVGNNGAGKSTLLEIIAGDRQPSGGLVQTSSRPYYIPQLFQQYNDLTVAAILKVSDRIYALREILAGKVTETNLAVLDDDWTIEDRCREALATWHLEGIDLERPMNTLSGGQKTKVFLAGISIHQPAIVLLDEPSNHLDKAGRKQLYDFISSYTGILIVVSHDRTLLNLPESVYELSRNGLTAYGGNYESYAAQKLVENNALNQDIKSREKALRKAKETARETTERQQKLDARGKKKQEKAGLPTISMNTFKNNAEKSSSRMKDVHAEKVGSALQELNDLRATLPDIGKIKFGFDDAALHKGKILIDAKDINYGYGGQLLWQQALSFQVTSGERIALTGLNGSGKTTLLKLILGQISSTTGNMYHAENKSVYIDQDYSLINNQLSVYEQAQGFNLSLLQEHEIKIRLTRFLFTSDYWDKPCRALSGGEKMRLLFCCFTISNQGPDIIILDEPTNNLDIQNIEILTAAINHYEGTLIVVSHDQYFLEAVNIGRMIDLK